MPRPPSKRRQDKIYQGRPWVAIRPDDEDFVSHEIGRSATWLLRRPWGVGHKFTELQCWCRLNSSTYKCSWWCRGRSGNLCNASKSWASAYWTYSTILQPRLRPRHRLPVLCFGAPLIGLFSIFIKQCDAHLHCISFSSAEFLQLFKLRTIWPTMLHLWLACWSACSGKTSLLLQFAYNCALRSEGTVTFMCRPNTFDLDPPCLSQVTP
jgi:hypothetical protein